MKTHSKRFYLLMVIAVSVIWGSAYPIVRYLVSTGVDRYLIVGSRVWISFLFGAVVLLCSGQKLHFPLYRKNFFPFALMSLCGTVGFLFFMTLGLQFSTATKSSLIIGSNPVLVVLFSYILLREPLDLRKGVGVLLAILGVFLAVAGGDLLSGVGLHFRAGDLILLLGAVCWATYTLLNRQYGHRMSYTEGFFWIFGLGALVALPLLLPRLGQFAQLNAKQWFWLIFCALVPGGLSYFLWNRGLAVLGASTCSICASFMPLTAAFFSVFFLHEPLLWTQLIGALLVTGGVLLGVTRNRLPVNYETGVSLSDEVAETKTQNESTNDEG